MQRREFITLVGGAAAAWPLPARAQQAGKLPVIALINGSSQELAAHNAVGFRKGLAEAGFVDGQNVAVEYYWLGGQYERVPAIVADLVRRRVAVITTPGPPPAAIAAKTATTTIPIVFGVPEDPVRLGLVASLAHPGGNVTGINFFSQEIVSKRLGLLHELAPGAYRVAVLMNPANGPSVDNELHEVQAAAAALGLETSVLKASSSGEIDAAFAAMARERAQALFVAGDGFFASRRVQFVTLTARDRVPATYAGRDYVEAGGLMSYAADIADMFRQVGNYAGTILKGTRPADLPVVQSTRFELLINLQTAKALGIIVPPTLLAIADEVIE
jgi:putative ABC transport system substrate-binding protein